MPIKYIPYAANPLREQALLRNIARSQRALVYQGDDNLSPRIARGLPYYDLAETERVGAKSENLVVRGDALHTCAHLKERNIRPDLVYIDPPFASGADYAKKIALRRSSDKTTGPAGTELPNDAGWEEKFYGDFWSKTDYLNWMFENLTAIREVMSDTGSIYVHLDWHIGHYVKVLMDEVFGESNFKSEVIWYRYNKIPDKTKKLFFKMHDSILFYTKGTEHLFNSLLEPTGERVKRKRMQKIGGVIASLDETIEYDREYLLTRSVIEDIPDVNIGSSKERTLYPTQKPEALLERLIKASSDAGMLVADFFGGSGTTAQVAARLGRKFVTADVGFNALHTTRDRLKKSNACFRVLDIKDGVRLFRNPVQTMAKIKPLIKGLSPRPTEPFAMSKFWAGVLHDKKIGMVPVYLPNLADHSARVLDVSTMKVILFDEIPKLEDWDVEKVIIYYTDMQNSDDIRDYIRKYNQTRIAYKNIELKDLKELLDHTITEDTIIFRYTASKRDDRQHRIVLKSCFSDSVTKKLDEYNQKRKLNADAKKPKPAPVRLSESGLEIVEMVSVDCRRSTGAWHSDAEVVINPDNTVTRTGQNSPEHLKERSQKRSPNQLPYQLKEPWDGKITCDTRPKRIKVRNIAGDETILPVPTE